MYTFVKFDDLINENNEIEAPESLKNLLYALVDNNYTDRLFDTWWETGDDGEEFFREKGIEAKTMKEIVDENPNAHFGFTYGYPQRFDITNASGYIESMSVTYEDYGVTAEELGLDD